MEDKIITDTLKYVAENIATICTALEKSEHIIGLTHPQKLLAIAITDSWVYLEKETLTITDLRNAVNYALTGTVCLEDNSKKHTYMPETKIEHLTCLSMQLGALFYQEELGKAEPKVTTEIIENVINRKPDISNVIKQTIKLKNNPYIEGYIKLIDIVFSNEIYKSAILSFKTNDATKTYTYVDVHDETRIEKIKRITVKILIWIGVFICRTLIENLSDYLFFSNLVLYNNKEILFFAVLEGIHAIVTFALAIYLGKKLTNSWDEYCFKNLSGTVTEKEIKAPEQPNILSTDITPDEQHTAIETEKETSVTAETKEPITEEAESLEPQEESEPIETSKPKSYKEQKKAARAAYRAEKKKLKQENYKPLNSKGFKIATAVLSIALVVSLSANIIQNVQHNKQLRTLRLEQAETAEELATVKKDYASLAKKYTDLEEEFEEEITFWMRMYESIREIYE